jgi:quinol monooxygenase YgiN
MITFIQCVRRRPELSIPQFRESWRAYGVQAEGLARATGALGLSMNTTLAVEPNLQVRLHRGTSEPYDGLLKIAWPNAAGLKAQLEKPEVAAALEAFRSLQETFIDLERSSFFFASEETLVDDSG